MEKIEYLSPLFRASVHDTFITYCAEVNSSTGAALQMTQESDDGGEIEQVLESDCTPFRLSYEDGIGSSSVILYQPVKDGLVYVNWTVGSDIPGSEPIEKTDGLYLLKAKVLMHELLYANSN